MESDQPSRQRYVPASLEDAANHLVDVLSDAERTQLRAIGESELIRTHFALGVYVRNHYDLDGLVGRGWSKVRPPFFLDPDGVSAEIIRLAWQRLRKIPHSPP